MPGRIEIYVHSDRLTENKGSCMIEVSCQTDFAAKTVEFKEFARDCARKGYAASGLSNNLAEVTWENIVSEFPDVVKAKETLEKTLREKITVRDGMVLRLDERPSKQNQELREKVFGG